MTFIRRNSYLISLVIIGLLWLLAFDYLTQMSVQGIVYPDSNSYRSAGENLYVFYRGDHYRPLLIAGICGIPYFFGLGADAVYQWSVWVNIFFWLGSLLMLFSILKTFLSKPIAFLLTLILLFSVGNTAYVFHLLTETIFIFMILSVFALLLRYWQHRDVYFLPWALSILVLSVLVKPGAQYFTAFVIVVFARDIWHLWRHKAMRIFYLAVAVWLVQCAGLWYQAGNFTVSYIDAPTYYNYLGSRVEELKGEAPREFGYIYLLPMPEQKDVAKADMIRHLTHDTDLFFQAYEWNLRENATSGNIAIADCKNIKERSLFARDFFLELSAIQNRIFSLAGLVAASVMLMFRQKFGRAWGLMAMFVLYTILLSAVSHSQGDRFTLVTYPFTILLIARLFSREKSKI